MQTIHCLSGLGADQRIFQKLSIPGYNLVPVPWCDFDKHDDLPCYAQKMAAQIHEEEPVIMGVSFGGMLASEIAKIRPVKKTILISSAKDAGEMPPVGGFVKFMIDHGVVPVGIAKVRSKQIFRRFGAESEEEKDLLMSILKGTDNAFARWSMKAISNWKSTTHVRGILHIHGTADRMIPAKLVKPDYWIEAGTHFMVYHNAKEISALISKHLA